MMVPPQVITAFSPLMQFNLLPPVFSQTNNYHPTLLSSCAIHQPRIFLLQKYFLQCILSLLHLLRFTIYNPLPTTPTSLLSRRRTLLSITQNSFNILLDLHPSCPHIFNIKRNAYTRFTRPLDTCGYNEKQNN